MLHPELERSICRRNKLSLSKNISQLAVFNVTGIEYEQNTIIDGMTIDNTHTLLTVHLHQETWPNVRLSKSGGRGRRRRKTMHVCTYETGNVQIDNKNAHEKHGL